MYHECSIQSVTRMPRRLVQVGNIIRGDLQLFHPRRLCCPQLKTRYNSFIYPMMTWPRTYPSTHTAERKKQAVSNRGGLSTYRNQNGGNKVEAWFGAHQEGADIIIVQHNCSARCIYTHQRGFFENVKRVHFNCKQFCGKPSYHYPQLHCWWQKDTANKSRFSIHASTNMSLTLIIN